MVTLLFDGLSEPSFSLTADFAQALAELAKVHLAEAADLEPAGDRAKNTYDKLPGFAVADYPSLESQASWASASKPEKPLADFSPASWDQAVIYDDKMNGSKPLGDDHLEARSEIDGLTSRELGVRTSHTEREENDGEAPRTSQNLDRQTSPCSFDRQFSPKSSLVAEAQALEFELRQVWVADPNLLQRVVSRMSTSVSKEASERKKERPEINDRNGIYQRSRSLLSLSTAQFSPLVHPESTTRLCWDLIAALLLGYDGIHLPLQFFEFGPSRITDILDWSVAVYWTIDMLVSCLTGVYVDGKLVMKIKVIVWTYLKTWFMFDIALVTFEWLMLVTAETSSSISAVSGLRGFRALRFLRLLRLLKIRSLLSHLQRTINSMYLLLCVDIVKHIMSILFTTHCVAGLWYYIGSLNDDGWVNALPGVDTSNSFKYLTAFHWGLCSFHGAMEVYPTNTWERLFAVVVVSLGLITFTMFVSSMTQSMLELQSLHAERVKQQRMLCSFLMDRKISRPLCVRIKNYLNHLDKQSELVQQDQHVKLLRQLPEPLLMEIYAEARAPVMMTHILCIDIYEYYPRALLRVCHSAINEQGFQATQAVFATGDVCNSVLIVESGNMIYVHQDGASAREGEENSRDLSTISKQTSTVPTDEDLVSLAYNTEDLGARHYVRRTQWISEASLWVKWEYQGILVSSTPSRALRLLSTEFAQVIGEFERAYVMSALYARAFVDFLNNSIPHDLLDIPVQDYLGSFKPDFGIASVPMTSFGGEPAPRLVNSL